MLPHLNRIQKTTALLFVLLLANSLSRAITGYFLGFTGTALLALAFIVLFPFAMLPLIRKLTWRVRNRLFVTYFLVGVLPILLIYIFVQLAMTLVFGQTTNYMLQKELDGKLEQLNRSAELHAQTALDGKTARIVSSGEGAILRVDGKTLMIPGSSVSEFPAWSTSGFKGVVRNRMGSFYLAAHARIEEGKRNVEVFAVRPFDERLLAELLPGVAAITVVEGETVRFRVGARGGGPPLRITLDSSNTAPPPPKRGPQQAALPEHPSGKVCDVLLRRLRRHQEPSHVHQCRSSGADPHS
jgi:hypothetical protein